MMAALMCVAAVCGGGRADASPDMPHVRPLDPCGATVIVSGFARSATVRAQHARLAASDVVAYVACKWMRAGDPDASLVWVSRAGTLRYVLVRISIDLDPKRRIRMLGHELQHAIEVAEAPWVREEGDLVRLFEQIGRRTQKFATYETAAAQDVERDVALEVSASRSDTAVEAVLMADANAGLALRWPVAAAAAAVTAPPLLSETPRLDAAFSSAGGDRRGLAAGTSQQGDVGVRVLPQRQERLQAPASLGGLARPGVRPRLPQPGERMQD
jgi:hypothetical protein